MTRVKTPFDPTSPTAPYSSVTDAPERARRWLVEALRLERLAADPETDAWSRERLRDLVARFRERAKALAREALP